MTNKKIMMIATTDNMLWQFMIPHIKHLEKLGNTVECVCAKTGFWFDELQNKFGFVVHEMDFARNPITPKNLKSYKKLVKLQKEKNFDLVYAQQPVGGLMGRLIAKKFKIPCIYTAHGFHFFKGCQLKNKLIYKTVEKWLSKYTDALITINEEDYESAKKMKVKNVFKINGIGIDDLRFVVEKFNYKSFRNEVGLNENDKCIVTVSEVNKNKNYETMLKAVKILIQNDPSIKFVSCGTGDRVNEIKQLAKKLGIENNCLFLGYRTDVYKILLVSNVFLHASHREGLTLSVIEAMHTGLPCVVSNVRGNHDLIQNEKGGFVVEPEDAEGFAEKLLTILENPNRAKEFGEFNKQESEKYKVEVVKKQLDEVYKMF